MYYTITFSQSCQKFSSLCLFNESCAISFYLNPDVRKYIYIPLFCKNRVKNFKTHTALFLLQGFLGVFFQIRSPSLYLDSGIDRIELINTNSTQYAQDKYTAQAINCWIAAGLYVVVFIFSFVQQKMNSRINYETS